MAAEQDSNDQKGVIERFQRFSTPLHNRIVKSSRKFSRWIMRRPRAVSESSNMLPMLIQTLAAFSKVDGEILEEEIDSSLGFLRYDYPDAVYSELRTLFRDALHQQQDLEEVANQLGQELEPDRKLLLCVQLYDLISKAGMQQQQVQAYYAFMSQLGMAAQAIDIVYQLNASQETDMDILRGNDSPLEMLTFGASSKADVELVGLDESDVLNAFRYHELILLKNLTNKRVYVRGRAVRTGGFCRIYTGQRIIVGEQVITYEDLVFYFNAKKNVSLPVVFVTINSDGEVSLERQKVRDSSLEVRFGLTVKVKALKRTDGVLKGQPLTPGKEIEAKLEDRIEFADNTVLGISDLRRRARAMGGRFALKTSKSEYLVSNNPALLHADDILLSPGAAGEILLKVECDYEQKVGRLEVMQADRPIIVRGQPVRNSINLVDGDTIRIDTWQMLWCDFTERIIEERRNIIRNMEVSDLRVKFSNGMLGLDGISFSANRGEMICVMGSSGSGKSTLLKTLAGQQAIYTGDVKLNGMSLNEHYDLLKGYLSYIPQDDAFDEHLTIHENLKFAAAIRAPHLSKMDRARRIDSKLIELGLSERRDSLVGSVTKKRLSGGERKRLNIGMDMIGSADIYMFDEPTSGLSSKDSEHVIEIIRGMSHNKIVMVTIHQPSSKLFQMFNKVILLDRGGRLVFFGTPTEALAYFAEAEREQHFDADESGPMPSDSRPEFIFDVLETPLRDLSGDIIYEENSRGQLMPARRYSPEYWRDRFDSHRIMKDVKEATVRKPERDMIPPAPVRKQESIRWREEWTQFRTLMRRAFMSKMRNRANLLTTVVEAPLLAALIAMVLRYSENGTYDYASAFHIPTYLFLGLVVAMFLGLTNSADDIIGDRAILQRERNLNVRLGYYVTAKVLALSMFAVLQCVLFIFIGNWILGIRGMFGITLVYMVTTAMSGVGIGLLISSLVSDSKTAVNIVPLILIPQIILGGALIKYEEMNKNLDFFYALERWTSTNPEATENAPVSELEVPFVCEFMPMRWSYEALIVAYAKLNPLTARQQLVNEGITTYAELAEGSEEAAERLDDLKEALALLSGLESESPRGVRNKLQLFDEFLEQRNVSPDVIRSSHGEGDFVTAEQLYVNQKVTDLVSKAEMEQFDYSLGEEKINVFFGMEKYYFGKAWSIYFFNAMVLNLSTIAVLFVLYLCLRNQLRIRAG